VRQSVLSGFDLRFGIGESLRKIAAADFKFVEACLTFSIEPVKIKHIRKLETGNAGQRQAKSN